jgi:hypothetical protein
MFSNRRRLRRWAAQVLLVWLFGLAMGVANACALGESAHHRGDAKAAIGIAEHHYGDERGDSTKVNCLDFCEKSSVGAPLLKIGDDGSVLGLAMPVSATLAVCDLPEPTVGRLVVDSTHLPGGPPPRIAFQRFAL